jgi:pyruvate/2-oxoglutarate dehydrogenase complex dihydrolipoamide acyltransferase (E2) component
MNCPGIIFNEWENMELRLPELSEDTTEAVITAWHVPESGRVEKDQDLLEVATDKATFDIPAPCDGVLTKIIKNSGETVKKDDVIAEIQEDRS